MLNRIGSGSGTVVFVKECDIRIGSAYQAKPFQMCEDHNWVQDMAFNKKTYYMEEYLVDAVWAILALVGFVVFITGA